MINAYINYVVRQHVIALVKMYIRCKTLPITLQEESMFKA